ncbi:RING finger domain protein [Penicillium hordei]|uniref:RING-type E3 ubiquitin transferase n=1 Tax=Penicillium hordei TaxID=40994 RepID=A0AAD6E0S0_9EURO|nr:RING finger domain protein [Penicillium hordei]KAJ5598526.1 RING finger domain protein [Penicillium hordei]
MSVPNESPKKESRLESSQPPDINKKYPPAAQQKTTQSASDVMFSNYVCAICLSIIEDGVQVRGLPCDHAFHVDCVDKWLLWRRPCCPVCKASYQKNLGEV